MKSALREVLINELISNAGHLRQGYVSATP
jgi:hypothetical protein